MAVVDVAMLGARHVHDRLPAEIRERLPEELRLKIAGVVTLRASSQTLVLLLLLAAVPSAPWAAQVLRPDTISHERSAGCHEDNGDVPDPAPISHSCCQGEHHPAILQQNSTSRPLLQVSAAVEILSRCVSSGCIRRLPRFVVASGGPPVMPPCASRPAGSLAENPPLNTYPA